MAQIGAENTYYSKCEVEIKLYFVQHEKKGKLCKKKKK